MINTTQKAVFQTLDELNIPFQVINHPPTPTVEDALVYWKDLDAVHCKNLFFRNKQGKQT